MASTTPMRFEPARPNPCNVLLVGLHRPTGKRYSWPVKTGDEFDVNRFWLPLRHLAGSLDYALRDFTASGMRRGDPNQKWEHDAALSEAVEAGRPPAAGDAEAPAVGS